MSKIPIAVDNSVLGDLVDLNLPDNKKRDNDAFLQIIELDHKGIFEIGIPGSTTMIEELGSGNIKREAVEKSWDLHGDYGRFRERKNIMKY